MGVEYDNPKNIEAMRESVAEWVTNRPTIKRSEENFRDILFYELAELNEAVINGDSSSIITEVGDVFFSLLALETRTKGRHEDIYTKISSYCNEVGTDLQTLFKNTWEKNSINYPMEFFNEMSPFIKSGDAMRCLRILRTQYKSADGKGLDTMTYDFDTKMANQPFFDGYVQIGKFREYIKKTLHKLQGIMGESSEGSRQIAKLIHHGYWGMEPLNIPNNQLNWHIW